MWFCNVINSYILEWENVILDFCDIYCKEKLYSDCKVIK